MEAKILREVLVEAERQAHKAKYASSVHSWRAAVIQICRVLLEATERAEKAEAETMMMAPPIEGGEIVPRPEDVGAGYLAPCGFEAKSPGGLGAHKFRCATCQAAEARA